MSDMYTPRTPRTPLQSETLLEILNPDSHTAGLEWSHSRRCLEVLLVQEQSIRGGTQVGRLPG